jgi:hypothetical protein
MQRIGRAEGASARSPALRFVYGSPDPRPFSDYAFIANFQSGRETESGHP